MLTIATLSTTYAVSLTVFILLVHLDDIRAYYQSLLLTLRECLADAMRRGADRLSPLPEAQRMPVSVYSLPDLTPGSLWMPVTTEPVTVAQEPDALVAYASEPQPVLAAQVIETQAVKTTKKKGAKLDAMTVEQLVKHGRKMGLKGLGNHMRKDTLLWRIGTAK